MAGWSGRTSRRPQDAARSARPRAAPTRSSDLPTRGSDLRARRCAAGLRRWAPPPDAPPRPRAGVHGQADHPRAVRWIVTPATPRRGPLAVRRDGAGPGQRDHPSANFTTGVTLFGTLHAELVLDASRPLFGHRAAGTLVVCRPFQGIPTAPISLGRSPMTTRRTEYPFGSRSTGVFEDGVDVVDLATTATGDTHGAFRMDLDGPHRRTTTARRRGNSPERGLSA